MVTRKSIPAEAVRAEAQGHKNVTLLWESCDQACVSKTSPWLLRRGWMGQRRGRETSEQEADAGSR